MSSLNPSIQAQRGSSVSDTGPAGPVATAGGREGEDRFETAAWGLLFLLVGALALPSGTLAYASIAAIGLAFLGLNGVRLWVGKAVVMFSVILGSWALIGGVGALTGHHVDGFALFFGILGLVTIVGALVRRR